MTPTKGDWWTSWSDAQRAEYARTHPRSELRKAERLNRTAEEMRHRNLTTGSGCRTKARAIERRLNAIDTSH